MHHLQPSRILASARKLALPIMAGLATASIGGAQSVRAQQNTALGVSNTTQASAVLADRTPVIDGKDDDQVWENATPITSFRVFDTKEDGDPSFPTEARIAYDAENLYVFVRIFEPHPYSIVS